MEYSKICIAQNKPIRGNIDKNIENHIFLISKAIEAGTDLIIFPELSLASYEPSKAHELAIDKDDIRLDYFQVISDDHEITIIVSAPIKHKHGVSISLLIFRPFVALTSYSKQHLHDDELPFFVTGDDNINLLGEQPKIALAICYEVSIANHNQSAKHNGADIYLTSVAKSKEGISKGHQQLSEIAKSQSMTTMMANNVGLCEEYECMGNSAVWNKEGKLLEKLDAKNEGLIIYDTAADEVSYKWQA